MKRLIMLIALLFSLFYSCRNEQGIREELRVMLSQSIDLSMIDSIIQNTSFNNKANYKIINYFDSSECIPCRIREFEAWRGLSDSLKEKQVETLFIFSPCSTDYDLLHFVQTNRTNKIAFAIDTLSLFKSSNSQIPNNHLFHTFLLDKDNNVIVVGNPIENEKIKELIFKKISE